MEKWKKIIYRLIHPPGLIIIVLPMLSFPICFLILGMELSDTWFSYIVYVLSAYSLVLWCVHFPRFIAFIKRCRAYIWNHSRLIALVSKTETGRRFLYDASFRGNISIYQGMTVNLLYVVFRVYVGTIHASAWFIAMAVYYMILALIRFVLGYCKRKSNAICEERERRDYEMACYKKTGIMMLFLNVAMGGMIVQMVWQNQGYHYSGYIIYLSALYTFYVMIMSVVNVVRFRKIGSPILSASKVITMISAMMSILGLQTAMISEFGDGEEIFRQQMNFATGTAVFAIVIALSAYMIGKAGKYRKTAQLRG